MSAHPNELSAQALIHSWARHLEAAFSGMTGESAHIEPAKALVPRTGDLAWSQEFRLTSNAALLVEMPAGLPEAAGRRVLALAGLTEASAAEARNTFEELLHQSFSALASDFSAQLGREVEKGALTLAAGDDPALVWIGLTWTADGMDGSSGFRAGVHPDLLESLRPQAKPEARPAAATAPAATPSKTIDLLLEVELPVSVSFGRSQMRLRELVKLGTGSIVELNRAITEPVEVIVNNCVIARGEVVVVEGNYGVRIRQIVSRQERLRSLF